MITVRKAGERGHASYDWLDTWHTFSFADYHDDRHMGFRALRVINDDTIAGGGGFGTHPHRDMEIITCVLSGALEHKDSMGNGRIIRPGEVQYMAAGTGVAHSEFNPSPTEPVHLLQIWILPDHKGAKPVYAEKTFAQAAPGKLYLAASKSGRDGSIPINQDADVFIGKLGGGDKISHRAQTRPSCLAAGGRRRSEIERSAAESRRRRGDFRREQTGSRISRTGAGHFV